MNLHEKIVAAIQSADNDSDRAWLAMSVMQARSRQREPIAGRKWFPHLDFTGDPMREGCFREPYPMAEEQEVETITDAADLLDRYASFIRTVKADDLELHPYLPEVERVAEELRALPLPKAESWKIGTIRQRGIADPPTGCRFPPPSQQKERESL